MRTLTALLLAAMTSVMAAQPADDRYVVRLDPTAAVDRLDAIAAQLAATHGASIVSSDSVTGDTIVLRMPAARVRTLAADPRVHSVNALKVAADAVIEPVPWSLGVSYAYDGAGSITRIGDGEGADTFAYDAVGRLVRAKVNQVTRDYTYDAFGNRKTCSAPGTDCQYAIQVNSANNKLVENATTDHDDAGNLTKFGTHTYQYDSANIMTADHSTDGSKFEYVYDADDRRIATVNVSTGLWTWALRDTEGKVLREFTSGAAGGFAWKRDYVYRDGRLLATRFPAGDGFATHHYHLDHLGTPRRVTDATDKIVGYHDYYAFGPEVAGGLQEPFAANLRYTGHEREQGSEPYMLDYMLARYYNPTLGRFLSPDRKDGSARPNSPQTWNRYAYVVNDPLKYIDPNGEDLNIAFDFRQSNLTWRERIFVMTQVRQRFLNAGVKTVNIDERKGFFYDEAEEKAKTDRTVMLKMVTHDLSSGPQEVYAKAGEASRFGKISTHDMKKLTRAELLNALVNIMAHEIGHASGVLPEHRWDCCEAPKAEKGSIMDQGTAKDRGAGLREFDAQDRTNLQKGLNPP